jgi:hypothetical protein
MIDCFLGTANLSLFVYLSQICGIFVRSKMLMFKRGSNSRRRGREPRIEAKARVRDSVARAQCRAVYLRWNAEELILRQVPGHSFGRESGAKGKSQQRTEAIGGGRSDEVQARHR